MSAAPYHRIRRLSIEGGFLDGETLEFHDHLNCIIGARGTGKSTVLEVLRWALNRMPDPKREKARHDHIRGLLSSNLEGAKVTVEIETSKGSRYTVVRTWKDKKPSVYDEKGEPATFSLGKGHVFDADFLSHNQIEEMASEPQAQLRLLDTFTEGAVERVEREIAEVKRASKQTLQRICECAEQVSFLKEVTSELPDLRERLKGLAVASGDEQPDGLRLAISLKALRGQEDAFLERLGEVHGSSAGQLTDLLRKLQREYASILGNAFEESPNRGLLDATRSEAERALEQVSKLIEEAADALAKAQRDLKPRRTELSKLHAGQEKEYQDLQTAHKQDRAAAQERVELQKQAMDLEEKERELERALEALKELTQEQERCRSRLSELREERFGHRQRAAGELTRALGPQVKVDVFPHGDRSQFASLLSEAMKRSGLRYQAIVDKIVERKLPPAELVSIVQDEDRGKLERRLGLSSEQAAKLIYHLKDSRSLGQLEVAELDDEPVIQLMDGEYKRSDQLSQGQKCTTILPILLLESERPLLIDQPEDNVDNAYVHDTICRSIRAVSGRRQLIVVTHSANIPVLGDAGRVFLMHSTGERATVSRSGSVDELREDIVHIMEGGKEAFLLRRDRYGI